MMKRFLLLFVVLLVACAPATAVPSKLEVSNARVILVDGDAPAAAYLVIKNTGGPDKLVGLMANFAEDVMMHQSVVDANGVAKMNMVMSLDVPAGSQVEFKPGGYHIMLMGLKPGLKAGDEVLLVLQFEQAGAIDVSAQVMNP